MKLSTVSYEKQHIPEVKAFNHRMKIKKGIFKFPERNESDRWKENGKSSPRLFEDYFLVIDEAEKVRGGYILKQQEFILNGSAATIGNIQLPLSEGSVNKKFNMVGLKIVNDALKKTPLLYALGMGGFHNPFPKFLKALGWKLVAIPFFFRIINPFAFFKEISVLRNTFFRKCLFDVLAYTGIGWLGIKIIQNIPPKKHTMAPVNAQVVEEFGDWADVLWEQTKCEFSFTAVRSKSVLNILYPKSNQRFIRLRVQEKNTVIGWVLLLNTSMQQHRQFGNMQVGSIIDCFSLKGKEKSALHAATEYLKERDADLVISNQALNRCEMAFKQLNYIKGPSNFIFAVSKKLAKLLYQTEQEKSMMHLNRGDGDGPMHL